MNLIYKKTIEQEEKEWAIEKNLLIRKKKISDEKAEFKKSKQKLTTTKLLILFLFINCTIIELFTGWSVVQSLQLAALTNLPPDFTPLVTLIGAVVGEVFGFAVYALKSSKENCKNGITYETTMLSLQNNNDEIGG